MPKEKETISFWELDSQHVTQVLMDRSHRIWVVIDMDDDPDCHDLIECDKCKKNASSGAVCLDNHDQYCRGCFLYLTDYDPLLSTVYLGGR